MGPIRSSASHTKGRSAHDDSRKRKSKRPHAHADAPTSRSTAVPGVQKIKSALRQTRRLLAKDRLAADVRAETERRLAALEADLALAENKRKERALALRYHKIKFFERQKVMRKIAQAKKRMKAGATKEPLTALENALFELRVDLSYILHYPKLEKYISLFPSSDTQSQGPAGDSETARGITDARRQEVRSWIRTKIEQGDFSAEPELEEGRKDKSDAGAFGYSALVEIKHLDPDADDSGVEKPSRQQEVEMDDFFEADEDSEDDEE